MKDELSAGPVYSFSRRTASCPNGYEKYQTRHLDKYHQKRDERAWKLQLLNLSISRADGWLPAPPAETVGNNWRP